MTRTVVSVDAPERPWSRKSLGYERNEISKLDATLCRELWVVAVDQGGHRIWLNGGTDPDGQPTWSSSGWCLYSSEDAAALVLLLDGTRGLKTYRMR